MTDSKRDDSDLKPYLDGSDRVSASYRSLGADAPPPDLDDEILRAARAHAGNGKRRGAFDYRRYSVAASVLLAVFVVSMFMVVEPPAPGDSASFQTETLSNDAPAPPPDEAEATNRSAAQQEAGNDALNEAAELSAARQAEAPRAPAADRAAPAYRQSMASWLAEIRRMTEQSEAGVAEERRLFAEAYPDVDLDEALEELAEEE